MVTKSGGMRKFLFVVLTVVFFVSAVVYFVLVPVQSARSAPGEVRLTYDEYRSRNILPQHRFVSQQSNHDAAVGDFDEKYIDLKLFGVFKIKRVKVNILPAENLVAGGMPIGFMAKVHGVVVTEHAPAFGFQKGDIIKSVNGVQIESIEDFNEVLGGLSGEQTMEVGFLRGRQTLSTSFEVNLDTSRQLGLWLKDETSGVGVLTYIDPKNNNFAALGHKITDYETGAHIDVRGGDVYCCNIIGVDRSEGGRVGEIKSALRASSGKQGSVISSNSGGVFGCLDAGSELLAQSTAVYPVASRYSVRPGAAKIRTSIDGGAVQEYDIEIIKTHFQRKKEIKSMIIRITDKQLLEKTGGIIHGMSGSPIIQDGKIVGALTHVMMGDATKGYGIYIDFVIP